jgi:SAM-dependent methyltransferase
VSKECDLTARETHFAFGSNWASYAKLVTEPQVEEAVKGLQRLAGGSLDGKRLIDIGCGSGLHSLAALRLGAAEVIAVDLDPQSVSTTVAMLKARAPEKCWRVVEASVFDLDREALGTFDVVYSWGVLHHTGDMIRAMRKAAALVKPGGMFIFALYRRTKLCGFWKREKRWYSRVGRVGQAAARTTFILLLSMKFARHGRSFREHVRQYKGNRGMDFYHDVHDWLGGWPYESISPDEVHSLMRALDMKKIREFAVPYMPMGMFGSGCDEYVYTPMRQVE